MRLPQKIKKAYTLLRSVTRHGQNLISLLDSVRHAHPELAFVDDGIQKISYQALYTLALQTAGVLQEQYHIKGRQKVLLACPNGIPFLVSLFALSALGCDIVLISHEVTETTLRSRLKDQSYSAVLLNGTPSFSVPVPVIDIAKIINSIPHTAPLHSTSRQSSQLSILSSGSQGTPGLHKRATKALRYYRPFHDMYTQLQLQQYRSTYIAIPFTHGYGLAAVLLSLFLEQRIYCHAVYGTAQLQAVASQQPVDCWIVVPSMIPALYRQREQLLQRTKAIITGGDRLEPLWVRQILEDTPVQLYNLYGTSQTGICSMATPEMLRQHPETLGKPVKGLRYKFIPCPERNAQELWVKCNWSALQPDQGYISTGDLLSADGKGYWFYAGRKDELRVVGGLNIYPAVIAEQIRECSTVQTVHITIRKDAALRSQIHATIAVHPEFNQNAFDQYLAEVLPEHCIHIHITPQP